MIEPVRANKNPYFAMTLLRRHNLNRVTFLMVLLLFAGGGLASVQADSITVNARLVLGTSKEKQGSKKVSESIRKRLAKVFKWMHYHQLSSKKLTIDDSKTVTSKLSKNASIKVTNQKNGKVSVSLFSGGKMLLQKTQTLRSGQYMVLAGKSTGDSAWLIVLSKSN